MGPITYLMLEVYPQYTPIEKINAGIILRQFSGSALYFP
jgi:hypothetical protein